ncbi:MAG: acyltransferase [Polyangiaceae bacterium]
MRFLGGNRGELLVAPSRPWYLVRMPERSHSETVSRVMFDWEELGPEEVERLARTLPRKIARWCGTHHPDNRTRKIFFRITGVNIAEGVVINPGLMVEDCYLNLVTLGERVSVAANVMLLADAGPNNSHLAKFDYVRENLIVEKPIVIEHDAWLGAQAVILPGVRVGAYSVVGAGSVVTKDVPPCTVVAGCPAKVIRTLEKPAELVEG